MALNNKRYSVIHSIIWNCLFYWIRPLGYILPVILYFDWQWLSGISEKSPSQTELLDAIHTHTHKDELHCHAFVLCNMCNQAKRISQPLFPTPPPTFLFPLQSFFCQNALKLLEDILNAQWFFKKALCQEVGPAAGRICQWLKEETKAWLLKGRATQRLWLCSLSF